jgi:hypothetical protein
MTNIEALRANISSAHGVVLDENHFVKALADVGLDAWSIYGNSTLIDRASLALYDRVLIPGANLSEGALSYNINPDSLRKARDMIAERLGDNVRRDIVDVSRPW